MLRKCDRMPEHVSDFTRDDLDHPYFRPLTEVIAEIRALQERNAIDWTFDKIQEELEFYQNERIRYAVVVEAIVCDFYL